MTPAAPTTATTEPDAALAGRLAAAAAGRQPVSVRRFPTGSQHYVFEVGFAEGPPVVARICAEIGQHLMTGASQLSHRLRPLGVPLPAILAEDLGLPFPHLILERLPGTDLGNTLATLSDRQLDAIAAEIARAQAIVAATPRGSGYGYAVRPQDAPRRRWSDVVGDTLARARGRLVEAGLFDLAPLETMERLVAAARPELDAQPPVPFLHDTTVKNVIVAPDGSFSGIVDVDDLCFGDPRQVVALTLTALLVLGGPTRYVDAWLHHAGLSDDRIFRLYVAVTLVDFMSEHGQRFNGNQRPSTPEARRRLLGLFAACLPLAGG